MVKGGTRLSQRSSVIPFATVVAAMVGMSPATADIYGGIGLLSSKLEPRVNESGFTVTESNSAGAQVLLGADVNSRLSIEGSYSNLGAAELTNGTISGEIDYEAAALSGVLYLYSSQGGDGLATRQGLMLYARGGLGYLDNTSDTIPFNRLKSTHFLSGVGVEYDFSNGFGVRAEWQSLDADAQDVTFAVIKRFGGSEDYVDATEVPMVENPVALVPLEPEVVPEPERPVVVPEPVEEEVVAQLVEPVVPADTDGDGVPDDQDLCVSTAQGQSVDQTGCVYSGVIKDVNFNSNSAALTPAATAALDAAIIEFAANPTLRIVIESHTDNRGEATSNMALSRLRAETVVRYLADVGGVDLGRMSAIGFGESRPLVSNKTAEGRYANRRVAIKILGK